MWGSFGAVANETSRSIIWKKRCFSKESLTRVLRGRSVGDSVKNLSASFSLHMRLRVIVYRYSCYDLELCDRDFKIFETRSMLSSEDIERKWKLIANAQRVSSQPLVFIPIYYHIKQSVTKKWNEPIFSVTLDIQDYATSIYMYKHVLHMRRPLQFSELLLDLPS